VSHRQDSRVFGKRPKQAHTIIFASGETIRHITVRPWIAGLCMSLIGVMAIGYLAATTYLVLRDDLIGASMARQARMQHAYEDRIAAPSVAGGPRDQPAVARPAIDGGEGCRIDRPAGRPEQPPCQARPPARSGGCQIRCDSCPGSKSEKQAQATGEAPKMPRLASMASRSDILADPKTARINPAAFASTASVAAASETVSERADRIFSTVTLSLKSIEREQIEKMQGLAIDAYETASEIGEIIEAAGLPLPAEVDSAVGGPFVRAIDPEAFEATLDDLDQALGHLDTMRRHARKLPIGIPAPGADITSRYGNRRDPFLGRMAFHGGIDFRVSTGTPINSAGNGIVIHAGRNGGYGKMIEIDHGGGLTTRYAHLSKILVNEGDRVTLGTHRQSRFDRTVPPVRICTTRSAATGMPWIRCGFSRPQKSSSRCWYRGSRAEQFMCQKPTGPLSRPRGCSDHALTVGSENAFRHQHLVDHMDDAIAGLDIGSDHIGVVDHRGHCPDRW
jgi:murein DD-endopeptidase MepM/ murein hydrolase activator NlpD